MKIFVKCYIKYNQQISLIKFFPDGINLNNEKEFLKNVKNIVSNIIEIDIKDFNIIKLEVNLKFYE